jgi:hypothetical protein
MSFLSPAVSLGRDGTADKATHREDSSVLTVQIAPASRVGEASDDDQRAVHPLMCTTARRATRGNDEEFRHATGLASGSAPKLAGAFPHICGRLDAAQGVL